MVGEIRPTQLNLTEAIGQLLVPRASGLLLDRQRRYPHWELDRENLQEAVTTRQVGGVLLFGGSLGDTFLKTQELQRLARIPLLICADLEAGCGQHIEGATRLPTARAIGVVGDPDFAYHCGALTGREARAVGINWVLAPCLDVANNPSNPVIGLRSFGEDPELVAAMGTAFAAGLRSGGVLTTAKHFPGHGDVAVDSHLQLPTLERTRPQLEREDWLPFRAAIQAGVDSIMTAHLRVPALDPEWPATFSRRILTEILREEWGYEGLIVTDALNMKAVDAWPAPGVRALQAGADLLMMPGDLARTVDLIVAAIRRGLLSEERIYASVERVLKAKARLTTPAPAILSFEERTGSSLERTISEDALILERDRAGLLPIPCLKPTLQILVVDACLDGSVPDQSPLLKLREFGPQYRTYWLEASHDADYVQFLVGRAGDFERVLVQVLTPVRAYRGTSALHEPATRFLEQIDGERTILASYTQPYLGRTFCHLSTVINAYNNSVTSHQAILERLER